MNLNKSKIVHKIKKYENFIKLCKNEHFYGGKGKNMYVSLGNDIDVLKSDIIGIFDIEKTSVVKSVNDFLSSCQKNGRIYYVSLDMPKSFVVCGDCVYVTNVGAATIFKRCGKCIK